MSETNKNIVDLTTEYKPEEFLSKSLEHIRCLSFHKDFISYLSSRDMAAYLNNNPDNTLMGIVCINKWVISTLLKINYEKRLSVYEYICSIPDGRDYNLWKIYIGTSFIPFLNNNFVS